MKKMNLLEWTGLIIFVLGFVFMIVKDLLNISNPTIESILTQHQIMYWLGLGLWAMGYLMRENKKKKELNN